MPGKHVSFEALSRALQSVELWLSRCGASRLMVAQPTIAAMKRQELPDHVRITSQKLHGPRVKVPSAHFMTHERITLAKWPQDGMAEYAIPIWACVMGGQADLLIADYVLHCQPGDMILFPPGIPKCNSGKPHFVGDPRGRSCDILWITPAVPTKGLRCYLCHCRDARHLPNPPGEQCFAHSLFLERLFEGFCEELLQRSSTDAACKILTLLLDLFKREIGEDAVLPQLYGIQESAPGAESSPIERACLYIETHLELQLTIKDVARQVYLSPTIFTRRFREHTGQSFKEYLTAQRLKKAVQLLQETTMTVYDVSYYVGLKPCQLRNLFNARFGCAPAEFRKNHLSS
jgi:AraC-like DNA-binding protein